MFRRILATSFYVVISLMCCLKVQAAAAKASSEPSYCALENFKKLERGNNMPYLDRAHIFQLGKVTVAGLGVGHSDSRYVEALARQYADIPRSKKSCTFYFNKGNDEAAKAFNHQYVNSPVLRGKGIADKYESLIAPLLDQTDNNMLECAEDFGFIALGCDGMRHRGPSVFAMLLAYSGCSAASSTVIANEIWGTNHVPTSTRTAIAQKGVEAGKRNPKGSARLRELFQR